MGTETIIAFDQIPSSGVLLVLLLLVSEIEENRQYIYKNCQKQFSSIWSFRYFQCEIFFFLYLTQLNITTMFSPQLNYSEQALGKMFDNFPIIRDIFPINQI